LFLREPREHAGARQQGLFVRGFVRPRLVVEALLLGVFGDREVVVADLDDVALFQRHATRDRGSVDLDAVVALEIFDRPLLTFGTQPRVTARNVPFGELDRVPRLTPDRDRVRSQRDDGRGALLVLDNQAQG